MVEPSWAPAHPFPALSESGCGDNTQDSFSRSFALVRACARTWDVEGDDGRLAILSIRAKT